jgi:hypothetical protein
VDGRADEYRCRAQLCLEMARTFRDRESRVTLAHMAQVWLRLAEHYEAAEMAGRAKVAGRRGPRRSPTATAGPT